MLQHSHTIQMSSAATLSHHAMSSAETLNHAATFSNHAATFSHKLQHSHTIDCHIATFSHHTMSKMLQYYCTHHDYIWASAQQNLQKDLCNQQRQTILRICAVWSVFADHICLLQPPGYPKRVKREPLPYQVDVHADLSLCWSYRSYCMFLLCAGLYNNIAPANEVTDNNFCYFCTNRNCVDIQWNCLTKMLI